MTIEFLGSPFEGEKVRLRPVELGDLDKILAHWNTYETRRFLLYFTPHSRIQEEQWIRSTAEDATNRKTFTFAIESLGDGQFLGTISIMNIDWISRTGTVGIAIHDPANHESGYGSDAMLCIMKFGFRILNLHRLELVVFDYNPRAKHVYEKMGFVESGRRRQVFYFEGAYHDEIMMDILLEEFNQKYA
jgi:RimJ/RimL family protein N-acetyltransferase